MTLFLALQIPTADELNDEIMEPLASQALQGRILKRGRRPTDSTATTTEVGVLRVDGIACVGGRVYVVETGGLHLISTVNSDQVEARVRFDTTGASATTASTVLPGTRVQARPPAGATLFGDTRIIRAVYAPATSQTLSLLLTVRRDAGTGSVKIIGTNDFLIEMWITDHGVDPTDTGVDI